jgi:hypothetical protein
MPFEPGSASLNLGFVALRQFRDSRKVNLRNRRCLPDDPYS